MCKRILVPLDGSRRAEKILPYVAELAQSANAEVVLLRVLESPTVPSDIIGTAREDEEWRDECRKRRDAAVSYMDEIQESFKEKGIALRNCFDQGPVVDAIIHTAQQEEADLIAVASHGRTGIAPIYYGSVAAGLLHRTDRPLLVIRADE